MPLSTSLKHNQVQAGTNAVLSDVMRQVERQIGGRKGGYRVERGTDAKLGCLRQFDRKADGEDRAVGHFLGAHA